jgi:hypothetical protein
MVSAKQVLAEPQARFVLLQLDEGGRLVGVIHQLTRLRGDRQVVVDNGLIQPLRLIVGISPPCILSPSY